MIEILVIAAIAAAVWSAVLSRRCRLMAGELHDARLRLRIMGIAYTALAARETARTRGDEVLGAEVIE